MGMIEHYKERLPWHGHGADRKGVPLRVYAAEELLKKALAQHNQKHSIGWLVYDLDSDTAHLDWQDRNAPPPNIVAINRENGHAHLFYGLETPVHKYQGASEKALWYLAAVDIALTEKLGADPGYSKLISKNPTHDKWLVLIPRSDFYDLSELESWLELGKMTDRRRRLPEEGYGRNVTLFHTLRRWAYKERRKSQEYLSEDMFREACVWRGLAINADFNPPLPHNEVRSTARSIARWTWSRMSPEGFRAWQSAQGKRSGVVRRQRAAELREAIVKAREEVPEVSQADIAAMLGVSRETVNRHLRNRCDMNHIR